MTETDNDKLLNQFFKENKKEIEDFGFSRRVMRKLPGYGKKLATIWTIFCSGIAIALFFIFDGIDAFTRIFHEAITTLIHSELTNINPHCLMIIAVVLIGMGIQRICSIE